MRTGMRSWPKKVLSPRIRHPGLRPMKTSPIRNAWRRRPGWADGCRRAARPKGSWLGWFVSARNATPPAEREPGVGGDHMPEGGGASLQRDAGDYLAGLRMHPVFDAVIADAIQVREEPIHALAALELIPGPVIVNRRGRPG